LVWRAVVANRAEHQENDDFRRQNTVRPPFWAAALFDHETVLEKIGLKARVL